MTLALLAVAGAVALWPNGRTGLRRRLRAVAGVSSRFGTGCSVPLPVVAGAAATALAAVLSTPLVALLAGTCAVLAARARDARRAAAGAEARLGTLAEALGALAAELRAGRLLDEAVRAAAAGCPDPQCAAVLAAAIPAPDGRPRADPGDRTGAGLDVELARLRAAVVLSARTGCSLAAVVTAVEDDLRARLRRRRAVLVATAGPRSSAVLLAGLPLLGLAMGSGVGADPWHVLTATGPGQLLLVAGVLLEIAGVAWTGRLVARMGR